MEAKKERVRSRQLQQFRAGFEALAADYFVDNHVHQDYLLTRAQAQ